MLKLRQIGGGLQPPTCRTAFDLHSALLMQWVPGSRHEAEARGLEARLKQRHVRPGCSVQRLGSGRSKGLGAAF